MSKRPISLRWKVSISVSLLVVAVAGAVAVALIRDQSYFLAREGEKRVAALAESLALNARDPLLLGDELRLGPVIQSVTRDPDVRYAYAADHRGTVVFHSEAALIGSARAALAPPAPGRVLEAVLPVVIEGTEVGSAVVGLDRGFIDQAVAAAAGGLLLPLVAGALLGVAGVFLLTGLHVRRLEALEGAVRALGAGRAPGRVEVGGRDEVARLAAHFNDMVAQLRSAREEIETGFTETVSALAAAIEAKDAYTRGHCERVARVSLAIAERLGLAGAELKDLVLAAILHDVGKIGVRAGVLAKNGRLEEAEFENMRRHPEIGERILQPLTLSGSGRDLCSLPSRALGRHRLPREAPGRRHPAAGPHHPPGGRL